MKYLLTLIFLITCSVSHARLFLDVSVVNKKGIDIGLTIGSEVHSREEVRPTEDINLSMKSGLSVLLRASFDNKVENGDPLPLPTDPNVSALEIPVVIGPSSKIIIRGRVIGVDGSILEDFFEKPLVVTLGETKVVTHSKDSQLVEIKIKPHIQ